MCAAVAIPLPASSGSPALLLGLLRLLWVGGQAVLCVCDTVLVPEGFVELVQLSDHGQAHVQVHLQVLQPLLQLGEGRPGKVKQKSF